MGVNIYHRKEKKSFFKKKNNNTATFYLPEISGENERRIGNYIESIRKQDETRLLLNIRFFLEHLIENRNKFAKKELKNIRGKLKEINKTTKIFFSADKQVEHSSVDDILNKKLDYDHGEILFDGKENTKTFLTGILELIGILIIYELYGGEKDFSKKQDGLPKKKNFESKFDQKFIDIKKIIDEMIKLFFIQRTSKVTEKIYIQYNLLKGLIFGKEENRIEKHHFFQTIYEHLDKYSK